MDEIQPTNEELIKITIDLGNGKNEELIVQK